MTGMIYSAPMEGISVSVVQDLWELATPSDACIEILSIDLTQEDLTTVELLRVVLRMVTGAPTSGMGGGTITPIPHQNGYAASATVVERNNNTQISGGTNVVVDSLDWNVVSGMYYRPIPDEMIIVSPSEHFVVDLEVAPSE